MRDLKAFLSQNKIKVDNILYGATKSLLDENGKPLEWEIRKVSTEQSELIRKECMTVSINKKGKGVDTDFNAELFADKLCVAATVYPDLYNQELQDSYGVKTPEALLKRLLDDIGEYNAYQQKVMEQCGLTVSQDDLVAEAKN